MLRSISFGTMKIFAMPSSGRLGLACLVFALCSGCASVPAADEAASPTGKQDSPMLQAGRYEQASVPDNRQSTWVFLDNHLFEHVYSSQSSDTAGQSDQPEVDWGRWWPEAGQNQVVVDVKQQTSGRKMLLEPTGDNRLLLVRDNGATTEHRAGTGQTAPLVKTGKAAPLAIDRPMQVCFMTQADAPLAYDPRARRHFPVLMAAAYPELEQSYVGRKMHPPVSLPVNIQGRWVRAEAPDGQGEKLHLRVAAVKNVIPGKPTFCPVANLTETFWALESLGGQTIKPGQGQREINLLLRKDGKAAGLAGCNRFSGNWQGRTDQLSFDPLATTRMMCPDRAETEQRYLKMLGNVKRFAIEGETLYLMDAAGRDLAVFGARYFN